MIGQKYYGVMNQPLLNSSKIVLTKYRENQKMNGHFLVFQPQLKLYVLGVFFTKGMRLIVLLQGSVTGATHIKILCKYALSTIKGMFSRNNSLF